MSDSTYVGRGLRRKEDLRFLRGTATYLPDLHQHGMLEVAFVRSTQSHALLVGIEVGEALGLPGVAGVLSAEEVKARSKPFTPNIDLPGLKQFAYHALADERVRYVGEPIAAVAAVDRYVAEDAAELIEVSYEPLDPVTSVDAALEPEAALLYPEWGDNLLFTKRFSTGDVDQAFAEASIVVRERFQSQRHSGSPLEGRGCLARMDSGTGRLSVWSSTQWPHPLRTVLADLLGLAESAVEVTAPDVGGGFGNKQHMFREEVAVCLLAMRLARPVRWIEDRHENLTASVHAREQIHDVQVAADEDGRLLGMRARITADMGDASTHFVGLAPQMVTVTSLSGPYRLARYAYELRCVVTNKCPVGAYRGFGRATAALTMERLMDTIAARIGADPAEVRRRNLVAPEEFPYRTATGLILDSGRYPECLDLTLAKGDYAGWRREQARLRSEDRYIGLGIACIVEGTAPSVKGSMGRFGAYDAATARLEPDGRLSVLVGVSPHGQGLETALAQVAADHLGTTPADVDIFHGNTASSPFGLGTWGGRSAAIGGAVVARAVRKVRDKVLMIAAERLEADPEDLSITDGTIRVRGASHRSLSLTDVAAAAYHDVHSLPAGVEPGIQFTSWYQPALHEAQPDGLGRINSYGAFSNATHLAVVEVSPETGQISILQHTVAHDCGTVINPVLVEGQVHGGVAQGIGGALLEELPYDETGQPQAGSFMDYLLPTATDVPRMDVAHLETPAPFIEGGYKAAGEGGTIGAPAALANAVADALAPFGVAVRGTPLSPSRVWGMLQHQDEGSEEGKRHAFPRRRVDDLRHRGRRVGRGAVGCGPAPGRERIRDRGRSQRMWEEHTAETDRRAHAADQWHGRVPGPPGGEAAPRCGPGVSAARAAEVAQRTRQRLVARRVPGPSHERVQAEGARAAQARRARWLREEDAPSIVGGMQQRVSLARALIYDPKVLLMDEPFGALDAMTREEMSVELLRIWEERRKSVLFVTHSISEAIMLADRVVAISARPGRIVADVHVGLPRPRKQEHEFSDEYQRCTQTLREVIYRGRDH